MGAACVMHDLFQVDFPPQCNATELGSSDLLDCRRPLPLPKHPQFFLLTSIEAVKIVSWRRGP
jgi:hypothetical protein